jgi:hypothetical protein
MAEAHCLYREMNDTKRKVYRCDESKDALTYFRQRGAASNGAQMRRRDKCAGSSLHRLLDDRAKSNLERQFRKALVRDEQEYSSSDRDVMTKGGAATKVNSDTRKSHCESISEILLLDFR